MLRISEEQFLATIDEMCKCRDCELSLTRTQVVPYRGDPRTDVMLVGEAPGYDEDREGKAMVGRTGSYLVGLLKEYGLPIENIYITNCLLCRPPENASPLKGQLESCFRWLNRHIDMVDPKVIVAVGRFACNQLIPEIMSTNPLMNNIEGKTYRSMYYDGRFIIPLRHPSAILRHPTSKGMYELSVLNISKQIHEIIAK